MTKAKSSFADTAARLQKPRPKLLDKREAKAKQLAEEIAQNKLVKIRSRGQCERLEELVPMFMFNAKTMAAEEPAKVVVRCRRRASQVHHLISGIGRKNVGRSIKAAHKLHICDRCHAEIHGHVLKVVNELERYEAATVRYERVK